MGYPNWLLLYTIYFVVTTTFLADYETKNAGPIFTLRIKT